MRIFLVGPGRGKRWEYFHKACYTEEVECLDWALSGAVEKLAEQLRPQDRLKVDPPIHTITELAGLTESMQRYGHQLLELQKLGAERFLNTPESIWALLDKKICKQRLQAAGIPCTPLLAFSGESWQELESYLREQHLYQVFLKPRWGAGAAGVLALRLHPRRALYQGQTSLHYSAGQFINTRHVQTVSNREELVQLVEAILASGAVVERWVPKAVMNGQSYDLRILWQFDQCQQVLARGGKGSTITNLHLQNQLLDFAIENVSDTLMAEVEALCRQAAGLFPGLRCIGFDVLLSGRYRQPRIIEMNAQGDLLYKDIFRENLIYREQVLRMVAE